MRAASPPSERTRAIPAEAVRGRGFVLDLAHSRLLRFEDDSQRSLDPVLNATLVDDEQCDVIVLHGVLTRGSRLGLCSPECLQDIRLSDRSLRLSSCCRLSQANVSAVTTKEWSLILTRRALLSLAPPCWRRGLSFDSAH